MDYSLDLHLFDGEGGAPASGAAGEAGGSQGAVPDAAGQGKSGEFDHVLFGKQPQDEGTQDAAAGTQDGTDEKEVPPAQDRRKAFKSMMEGEYKDLFTEEVNRIVGRRFKESKATEEKLAKYEKVVGMMCDRYRIGDADPDKLYAAIDGDEQYWETAAEDAGMSVEQYRGYTSALRENAAMKAAAEENERKSFMENQVQGWYRQAEELKGKYPDFDLAEECRNEQFMAMLQSNVPVEHAYKIMHYDELVQSEVMATAQKTERRVVDNIRARGMRPKENGSAQKSAFTVRDDPSKLTNKELAEIARRVQRGEKISF